MALDLIWEIGTRPVFEELQGKFDVKVLSGIFKVLNLRYKNWSKKISQTGGVNIRNGKIEGYFYKYFPVDECLFDYDLSVNDATWNRLNDHVRRITADYYIGKIYFRLFGKYRFCGYFDLTRKVK